MLAGGLGREAPLDFDRPLDPERAREGLGYLELPARLDELVVDDLREHLRVAVAEHDLGAAGEHRVRHAEGLRAENLPAARALRVVRSMEAGTISVNSNSSVRYSTPFGGFKQSGLGREHSMAVLDHYTELKNVFVAT